MKILTNRRTVARWLTGAVGRHRGIRVPRATTGRPRGRPDHVPGDKADSSRAIRHLLRPRGIVATIPERRDRVADRHRAGVALASLIRWLRHAR